MINDIDMDTLKKSLAIFYIIVCLTFITWLMIINEWKLAAVAIIISSFIVGDILKNFNKIFARKQKPHIHNWTRFLTTGKGETLANLYRCDDCGEEIVKHKGGTFKLDK